jgi:Mn-dependent DtxR family transcriptional regulator
MIKRLAEQDLLRHEPYYGVRLTGAGELAALRIIRRHRVLELFLVEVLGYEWDRVHDEAERLEHAASDELIERLARLLGEPERDPHGNAIPTAAGEVDRGATRRWASWPPATRGGCWRWRCRSRSSSATSARSTCGPARRWRWWRSRPSRGRCQLSSTARGR